MKLVVTSKRHKGLAVSVVMGAGQTRFRVIGWLSRDRESRRPLNAGPWGGNTTFWALHLPRRVCVRPSSTSTGRYEGALKLALRKCKAIDGNATRLLTIRSLLYDA